MRQKSHIHYVTFLKGALGLLTNPEHTESVFDIEDGLRDVEATSLAMEYVSSLPGVAPLMEERYLAPEVDLAALERCPEASLGRAFVRHITDHGFDPDYFRKTPVRDDIDWVLMRMRQTHDIWHVITGLGVDRIGELALKACELAQTRRPVAAAITAGGVFRYLLKDPAQLDRMLTAVAHGYRLGARAKPFLAAKWELGWDRPLAEWRHELRVDVAIASSPYVNDRGSSAEVLAEPGG